MARYSCSGRKKNVRAPSIPKFSSRAISIPPPRAPIRRGRSTLLRRVGRWRKRARWGWCKLNAVPKTVRIVVITATILRAIELTAVFLDRNVTTILAGPLKAATSAQQRRELAAIIHLCGASSAKAFARRGFHPIAGERCGDQEVATYLAQINAMTREFLRIEAER